MDYEKKIQELEERCAVLEEYIRLLTRNEGQIVKTLDGLADAVKINSKSIKTIAEGLGAL